MQKYLKAALIGGGIGFGVGAAYAIFFVAYRDSVQKQRAEAEREGAEVVSAPEPDEPSARQRIAQAARERTARAKAIREQNPGMSWPEALSAASRNGVEPEQTPVEEDSENVE